jgi:hypothetical protein
MSNLGDNTLIIGSQVIVTLIGGGQVAGIVEALDAVEDAGQVVVAPYLKLRESTGATSATLVPLGAIGFTKVKPPVS